MSYRIESQIQQPKTHPITFVQILNSNLPILTPSIHEKIQMPERICFADAFNNLKIIEHFPQGSKSFLLTKFNTKVPESVFTCLHENPVSHKIMTGDSIGRVHYYKVSSKSENAINFKPHLGKINSIDFSTDGRQMITSSNDKTVKLYDISKFGESKKGATFIQSFVHKNHVKRARFSNNSVFSIDGKALRCFDLNKTAEDICIEAFPKQQFTNFHMIQENMVILQDEKTEFRIMDLRSKEVVRAFFIPNIAVRKSDFSAEKLRMVLIGESLNANGKPDSQKISVFNVFEPGLGGIFELEPKFQVTDVSLSTNGCFFAAGTQNDGTMIFRSVENQLVKKNENKFLQKVEQSEQQMIIIPAQEQSIQQNSNKIEENIALEKSINLLINTITMNSKNNLKNDDLITNQQFGKENFVNNFIPSVTCPANIGTAFFDIKEIQNSITNDFLPHLAQFDLSPQNSNPQIYPQNKKMETFFNTQDFLISNSIENNEQHSSKFNMEEMSLFIKNRENLLVTEKQESDFSFKVTAPDQSKITHYSVKNVRPQEEIMNTENKVFLKELTEQTFSGEQENEENIFINVLGRQVENEGNSPITIIDQKFEKEVKC